MMVQFLASTFLPTFSINSHFPFSGVTCVFLDLLVFYSAKLDQYFDGPKLMGQKKPH